MSINVNLITETGESISLKAEKGQSVYELLSQNAIKFSAPCGGRGKCGKCRVDIISADSEAKGVLACRTNIEADCEIRLSAAKSSILTEGLHKHFASDGLEGVGFAADIGTTTVAAYLMDLNSGETLGADSFLNPQRVHGADVISRMEFALASYENRALLQNEIISALEDAIIRLLKNASFNGINDVQKRVIVGNTAMMHLAGLYDTAGIAKAPYMPEYTALHRRTIFDKPYILGGCVSGYVGADTVAAMLACDMDKAEDNVLLIDIGTNGEIALRTNDGIRCCSCAAGPAFEGAHIACGTGAVAGAVDHLSAVDEGFKFSTIGCKPPIGICGSGLIDAINYLVSEECISPSGRMTERFNIADGVYIDPKDVREVQLAKAAIAAGIEILIDRAGIGYEQIDRVLIAGGFGNFIDVHSACGIGLLPAELENKIKTVGNAAGDGAKMLLLSHQSMRRAEDIRRKTEYIELSTQTDFEDIYTDNLLFVTD